MFGSVPVMCCSPTRSERKKALLRKRLFSLPESTLIFFEDETDLLHFPPLQAKWVPRGETAKVSLSGWNGRRAVYGALDIKNGERLLLVEKRQRALEFCHFLHWIREVHPRKTNRP